MTISNPLKAYSRATHTVSKTRQVVMLYDGAIRFLQQAMEAIERKDYEARYHKLMRVSDIMVGLQASLDFNAGDAVAGMLYDFYASVDRRLFALHRSNDIAECQALIAAIKEMREAWHTIDCGKEAPDAEAEKSVGSGPIDSVTFSA